MCATMCSRVPVSPTCSCRAATRFHNTPPSKRACGVCAPPALRVFQAINGAHCENCLLYTSLLVVGIVIVMYVGFLSSNIVVGGQALASLVPGWSDTPSMIFIGVLGVVATIYGYDLIHGYTRVMTYLAGAVLALTFVWIIYVHGLPADFLTRNSLNATGFIGTISVAALWQISYAPYVSDYTRYMPADTGASPAFWASYWGCTLGLSLIHI